jgi:hypothetical protein
VRRALAAGFDRHLKKPVRLEDLNAQSARWTSCAETNHHCEFATKNAPSAGAVFGIALFSLAALPFVQDKIRG